jgi:NADH-ubiquinone oxidoreductase chain 2
MVNSIIQAWDIVLVFSGILVTLTYISFIGFKQAGGTFVYLIKEYALVIHFTILGQIFLISSSDIVSFYISIELQSFGVYLLASLYKESLSSIYSGLKYFMLGGIASAFILFGIAICYSYTGTTNIEYILSLISTNTQFIIDEDLISSINFSLIPFLYKIEYLKDNPELGIILGLLFISFGILFKVGSAPIHQ